MYFAVFVTHKPEAQARRSELQDSFRRYLHDHPDHPEVVVHHSGPTVDDDADNVVGLLLIVKAPSSDAVRTFLAHSPYGKADIFAESRIRRWEWSAGRPG